MLILMSNYASNGTFTSATATMAVIAAFLFLVLPQIGLGVYLIWDSMQETAVTASAPPNISSPKNPPPTK